MPALRLSQLSRSGGSNSVTREVKSSPIVLHAMRESGDSSPVEEPTTFTPWAPTYQLG